MDAAVSGRSGHGGDGEAVEEKPRAVVVHHRDDRQLQGPSIGDIAVKVEKGNPHQEKENMKMESLSSEPDSSSASLSQNEQNDRLETARAEMGEAKEENEKLKMYLDRIMREYKALQMKFFDIVKQGGHDLDHDKKKTSDEEHDHISLSLGPTGSGSSLERNHDEKNKAISSNNQKVDKENNLELSLDWKLFEGAKNKSGTTTNYVSSSPINLSPENSFEDQKEETDEFRPPCKVQKTGMSGNDYVSQQKKTRVSVRARCDTPTMNDGCQWRKYGQKISKGNPCPRAYYRCTIAPSCPVRKQVQRCADDMSILITTYEGTHNHPLPVSATSMASTTSAAASMLLSGSSSSTSGSSHCLNPNATTDLRGLNYYLSDPSRSKQFYLPNTTSMASAPTHPTITLDLTNSNPNSTSLSHFNRFTSNNVYSPVPTRSSYNLSTTSVSFGPSEPTSALPISWGNGLLSNYGNAHQLYPKSQSQETFLHHLQKNIPQQPQDSIAAATKAITTDPNFQSALASALKSIIGGNTAAAATASGFGNNLQGGGDSLGQRSRWNNDNMMNSQSTLQGLGCGPSFLNNTTLAGTNSHQLRNLVFAQPSISSLLPHSNPKNNGSSTSSNDNNMDHSKLL